MSAARVASPSSTEWEYAGWSMPALSGAPATMNARAWGPSSKRRKCTAEVYLRVLKGDAPKAASRAHFLALASTCMRQILVDHARRRGRDKRGGGERPITLDSSIAAVERPEALVALDDALVALEALDARKAKIVELSYFSGLTQAEIASLLEVHVNTVARDLRLAEAWIYARIRETTAPR